MRLMYKEKRERLERLIKNLNDVIYSVLHKRYIEMDNRIGVGAEEYISLEEGVIRVATQQIIDLIKSRNRREVFQYIIFRESLGLEGFEMKRDIEREYRKKYKDECNIELMKNYRMIRIGVRRCKESSGENKKCVVQ